MLRSTNGHMLSSGVNTRFDVQMARDGLPCDTDATFRMACASVSHHARATGGRKFKVASKGTKLFDEAYRCRACSHSARQLLCGAGLLPNSIQDTRTRVARPWHVKHARASSAQGAEVLVLGCLSSNPASPAIRHGHLLPVYTLCGSLSAGRRTRGTSRRRIRRPSWRRQVRLSILTTPTARTSAASRGSTKCTWATTKPPRPSVIVPLALSICGADPACVPVLLSATVRGCVFPFVSVGVLRGGYVYIHPLTHNSPPTHNAGDVCDRRDH